MGGTQFNGLALVWELARAGHAVTILNRGKTPAELPRGVRRLVCDRTQPDAMRKVLGSEEFDCVHDISGYKPEDVELMIELLRGRTGHYVFASSTVIYAASNLLPITEEHPLERGENQIEYGLNKILCEDILLREFRETGFPSTVAAFSMVFGPNNIIPDREQRMFVRLARGRKVLIPGDGTTLGQIGHVQDEARALRMMMQNSRTFGRRYNLTGGDYYSDEGYVDTFAEIVGVEPEKTFIPAELMDDLWEGRARISGGPLKVRMDARGAPTEPAFVQRFQLQRLIQRLAPNLHHWNLSVLFGIDRLRRDVGWEPEYSFRGAVEQTWGWMQANGLVESREFDFGFEDDLLTRIQEMGAG